MRHHEILNLITRENAKTEIKYLTAKKISYWALAVKASSHSLLKVGCWSRLKHWRRPWPNPQTPA